MPARRPAGLFYWNHLQNFGFAGILKSEFRSLNKRIFKTKAMAFYSGS